MKASHAVPCLLVLFGVSLAAQTKITRFRGTVEDANTKKPIAGATVSASGDTGQRAEITDDNGFFRLVIEGVAPGDIVRLRVVKPGYTVYDRQVVASEEIPITVDLHRSASAAVSGPPHTPSVSSDPVTARYIEELNTEENPLVRLNALEVVMRSAAKDSVALDAVTAAVKDANHRVRQTAAYDLGKIGQPTSKVITTLRIALDDPEPLVRHAAMDALGKLSSNKEALDALFNVMGAPPNVNLYAAGVLNNFHIDDPRVLNALIYEATVQNERDAADALVNNPLHKGAIPGLFLALGVPPNVNISAMNILQRMGSEDPRLISALAYEATVKKSNDAIAALGRYPRNKDAVEALLLTLGTPAASNDTAMTVLCNMGIDDPRLSEVLLANANAYNAPTISFLKKAPPSQDRIVRIVQYVSKSLDLPQNFRAQIYIDILLKAGGVPGRQALHRLLVTSDAQHQALLALAWLETDHNAAAELLPDLHLPDTESYLVKLARTPAMGTVALPEYKNSSICNEGPSLRAIMGLSILNLAPREHPTASLIRSINAEIDSCSVYAAAVVAWHGPSILKAASANLIHSASCNFGLAKEVATDTLALLGNEKTIAQLQTANNTNTPDIFICDGGSYKADWRDLIARIRSRLNAKQ